MTSLILAILIGWGGVMPVHVSSTEGTSIPEPAPVDERSSHHLRSGHDLRHPTGATTQLGTVAVGGWATWYAYHEGQAAAGPALRHLLDGHWRDRTVVVSAGGHSVIVKLTDWCACGKRNGRNTVIDLDSRDFAKLAPLSQGIVIVSVEYGGSTPTAPPTDVE